MRGRNHSRLKKSRKMVSILSIVLLLALAGIGTTYTYARHKAYKENTLRAHSVEVGIVETPADGFQVTPGGDVMKNVKFKNEGSAAVFLRVSYAEVWLGESGSWLQNEDGYAVPHWLDTGAPDEHIDSDLWFYGGDSWYYYKKVLPPGGKTEAIMDYVTFAENLPDEYINGSYELLWVAEVVQFSTDETRTDGKTVNEAALEATFKRIATISDLQIVNSKIITGTVEWH